VFEPFAGFLLSAFTLSPFGWARYPFLPEHCQKGKAAIPGSEENEQKDRVRTGTRVKIDRIRTNIAE